MTALLDSIWDELRLGRDLAVRPLQEHPDGAVTYQVELSVELPADTQTALQESGAKYKHSPAHRLRHLVKLGLRVCFGDDDSDKPVAAGST